MRIYDNNGYVDIRSLLKVGVPFIFCIGGRGTGKTFTSLKTAVDDHITFMLMRRTQTQLDLINTPEFNPFKALNIQQGYNITTQKVTKYNTAFIDNIGDEKKIIGYSCALSTISNMRGFDGSDIELLIFDEFIPERHEKPIRNEATAYLNAVETIARNRELNGDKPLQCLCLANSNDLSNPLFLELGLVSIAEKMKRKGQQYRIDPERGYMIVFLDESNISKKKRETALYRLTKDSGFTKMAIGNDFVANDTANIKSQPLKEYRLLIEVGEIYIYEHKNTGRYYVSTKKSGTPVYSYTTSEVERERFQKSHNYLWWAYLDNLIDFEDYACKALFENYNSMR